MLKPNRAGVNKVKDGTAKSMSRDTGAADDTGILPTLNTTYKFTILYSMKMITTSFKYTLHREQLK